MAVWVLNERGCAAPLCCRPRPLVTAEFRSSTGVVRAPELTSPRQFRFIVQLHRIGNHLLLCGCQAPGYHAQAVQSLGFTLTPHL